MFVHLGTNNNARIIESKQSVLSFLPTRLFLLLVQALHILFKIIYFTVIVTVFEAAGLTVSEKKTETTLPRTPN